MDHKIEPPQSTTYDDLKRFWFNHFERWQMLPHARSRTNTGGLERACDRDGLHKVPKRPKRPTAIVDIVNTIIAHAVLDLLHYGVIGELGGRYRDPSGTVCGIPKSIIFL